MRKFKLLPICMMLIAVMFTVGCDVAQIMDVVTKVADGIQQAAPAIGEAINSIKNIIPNNGGAADNTNTNTNNEQPANNNANVRITNPGDQEEVGNTAAAPAVAANATAGTTGAKAVLGRISSSIKSLINSTSFRGADVDGGNLACAKVVSTALKNAGVLSRVSLNCDAVVSDLKNVGWRKVNVPPYQDGDVVTWTTRRGPGRHIGIIVKQGSSFMAVSNSSSQRTPRMHSITYSPITQVLRKA